MERVLERNIRSLDLDMFIFKCLLDMQLETLNKPGIQGRVISRWMLFKA